MADKPVRSTSGFSQYILELIVERSARSALHVMRHKTRIGLTRLEDLVMHGIIYLVGLIVVVLAILSFFGLR
jgi:hypothetical protein